MKWIAFNQLNKHVEIVLDALKDGFHVLVAFYVVVMIHMWQ
jgi:hypothetical protein